MNAIKRFAEGADDLADLAVLVDLDVLEGLLDEVVEAGQDV